MVKEIKFYIREEPYGFLSNFWRHEQKFGRETYPTNEHYYQSFKPYPISVKLINWIASAPTAKLAMQVGRMLTPEQIRPDWEDIKVSVMLNGLRSKFRDPNLALMLKWTGDAILIEDSPTDMFWGGSLPGSANMLGKLLMHVRDEVKKGYQIRHASEVSFPI